MPEDLTPDARYGSGLTMTEFQKALAAIRSKENYIRQLERTLKKSAQISNEKQERIVELHEVLKAFVTAATNFVAKVDSGNARSVKSYAEFRAALKRYEAL